MVLTNAERQKRFRERRNALARGGVTADMVVEAARIVHEDAAKGDPSLGTWDDWLRHVAARKNWPHWRDGIPADDPDDPEVAAFYRESYGADADLILKVARIVRAVMRPPTA